MTTISLSQDIYENLVQHLSEIQEGKSKLIAQYYPEPSKERYDFEDLLDRYIKQIDRLVESAGR